MSQEMVAHPRTTFTLPPELSAAEPPEARGLTRDGVRLLVSRLGGVRHGRFTDIKSLLRPGDLVVVNTSATLAAAVEGTSTGHELIAHFSSSLGDGTWAVELRARDNSGPAPDIVAGDIVDLRAGVRMDVVGPHPHSALPPRNRLWRARPRLKGPVETYLAEHGRPITYSYVRGRWPLSAYQTVFATEAGSAEMPSAGRPFTHALVTGMVARGINFAPIVLHAGVSSLEAGEPPPAERFRVPPATAWLVNQTRAAGGLVIAVGTTVARALETVARSDGTVSPRQGWTDLVLGPDRRARVVDGLITGWHSPQASHLLLLEAVAGIDMVQAAYDAAVGAGYLWHEFGDSCLLLAHGHSRRLGGTLGGPSIRSLQPAPRAGAWRTEANGRSGA